MRSVKRTSHAVYDFEYDLVWASKYRTSVLKGSLGKRLKIEVVGPWEDFRITAQGELLSPTPLLSNKEELLFIKFRA